MRNLDRSWNWLRSNGRRISVRLRPAQNVVSGTITLVFFILTLLTLCFVAADTAYKAGTTPWPWLSYVIESVLSLFMQDPQSAVKEAIVAGALAVFVSLITVWVLVVQPLRHRSALRKASIVDSHPVGEVGNDDLTTMYRYYSNAEHITVFSGDFDWILKHEKLKQLILKLAKENKIELISYKTEEDIKAQWNDGAALAHLKRCFKFHEARFKFTLINHGSGRQSFLSLVPATSQLSAENIGVDGTKNHQANALLHVVSELAMTCKSGAREWKD